MKKALLLTTIILAVVLQYNKAQTVPADTSHYISINFDIPQLQRKRDVQILLPEDYYRSKNRYPVIYMQDAQNIYDKKHGSPVSWGVDSVLESLPMNEQVIIVGINHGGNQRIAEYSPYKTKYGPADGPAYIEFLLHNLKPYIDTYYRTKPDAKHTAVAGSSMGGLIAFYASIKYPEVFGTAGVFSPSLWINPEIDQFVKEHDISKRSRFFFACGDQEGNEAHDVLKMDSLLRTKKNVTRKNLPEPVILKGQQHNERQWRLEFPGFYRWFIKEL